jgi:hypothetical protein
MFKKIWLGWRRFGQWLGDQIARVFLVTFYFTIALPFGLLVRLTQDPLDTRNQDGGWTKHQTSVRTLVDARRFF